MIPEHWPSDFSYSPESIYVGLPANLLMSILSSEDTSTLSSCIEEKKVHPHLQLQTLQSPHPLAGERGVFATQMIPLNTELGEYVGEVFLGNQDLDFSKGIRCWLAHLNGILINISSHRISNELGFVNDYRGLGKGPNVGTAWILHRGIYHFGFRTLRTIDVGEELLIDYGQTWEKIWSKKNLAI